MNTSIKNIESLSNHLTEVGFLHLKSQTENQLNDVISLLGEVIFTTDVVVKSESKSLVTSERGLDYHTDHHKAKYVVWYCYKQTDKGGESILMDAKRIFQQLSNEHQEQLKLIELFEHKIFSDDKDSFPLVSISNTGEIKFYYSFWLVKNENKQNPALLAFQKLIRETPPTKICLKEGDILIVNNQSVFHGRTPIEGSKDRFLKRYWIAEQIS